MAYLDPQEAFKHLSDRVIEGIGKQFPIKGRNQTLHLDNLEVRDVLHPDDLRSQHKAKVSGDSWAAPLYATLTLKDNATGDTLESKRVRVAQIPKLTKRYSYIVDGQEYQIDNQWRLKPGAYVRRNQNNEIVTKFNIADRNSFDLLLDPADKQFRLVYNKSRLPLYPIMKAMGMGDAELEAAWGKDLLEANRSARGVAGTLERLYKSDKKVAAPSKEAAEKYLVDTMMASRMRPDSTLMTLGKPFENVTGEVLQLATKKMLAVHGGHPEDDRDSLMFKDLCAAGDFAYDKIKAATREIQIKAKRQLDRGQEKAGVNDIVKFELFNKPIRDAFHKNSAARVASQINPVEMISSSFQTTIMGPGGIQSDKAITDEAKFVNPSHLGYLDPIHTPEGDKTGVTLRLPLGVRKIGNEPHVTLFNIKTGKIEPVAPGRFLTSNVVLPDQVEWKNGKPIPLYDTVKMSGADNAPKEGKFSDAQYVMRHSSQLFNMTSNLIPFLGSTSGNRASMASRHIEQAISLLHREAPLVQVATGGAGVKTFEELLGHQAAHTSPIEGTVVAVKNDGITIHGPNGAKHEVLTYNNYPLNDAKSVLHSTPVVKVGDKVSAGQLVADTNFSKNGTLALGANLRVGYIPFKGYNFEDGVVISETAAKKLSSEHLHKHDMQLNDKTVLDKKKFEMHHLGVFTKEQLAKLGDDGVIKAGHKVKPGDPLIAAMQPFELKDRVAEAAIRRSMTNQHSDASMRWDSDYDGEVVAVHRNTKGLTVHIRTVEPMQVGDKLAGRYGNKGIVTMILDDKTMPHTKDGKPIEVALNPSGVPGRMNVGQVLETAAAKIAQKTGKTYIVHNFQPNVDFLDKVKKELKAHGLSDTEELHDPETGKSLGQALVGPQHMLKLVHQVDKKLSVRSGMSLPGTSHQEHYDLNLQPTSGGGSGGQSMGTLGMYAMLAHGATANIREMQTWKSEGRDPQTDPAKQWPSQHAQVWNAIQTGQALPTPKPTFAFHKFTDMLRGSGINIEKKGNEFVLTPLTDKHILQLVSEGENNRLRLLPKAAELVAARADKSGDFKPKPGGLFDEKLTGGHGGRKWSAIQLAEPMPNPVFEGPIKRLTGLSTKDYEAIVHGEKSVSPTGQLTALGKGVTGGEGIKLLLDRVDVQKDLVTAKAELDKAPRAKVDVLLKKVKYLQALNTLGMKPSEAYVLHYLPVLPPVMRAVSALPSGDLKYADVNGLYSDFAQVNDKLKDPILAKNLTDSGKQDLRKDYYDGVSALMGIGTKFETSTQRGLLAQISGAVPKNGFFQNTLLNRRQDLSMRSTIVPEPSLGLDEVGLPKSAALRLFSPFVVRKLVQMGGASDPLHAQKVLSKTLAGKDNPAVWRALDQVTAERPVLLKRDPALHKYSVQAFKVRTVPGNAIQIHPLVTGGYNADFDGDAMSVFVPIHQDAVAEAHKMFPSNNLFSEATGKVAYQPTLESALGLYKLSRVGKETTHKFTHPGEALAAVQQGKTRIDDLVHIGAQKTTAGRVLLAAALPDSLQHKIMSDLDYRIDKKGLDKLLTDVAKNHAGDFGVIVNRLKDLGNGTSFGAVAVPRPTDAGHPFDFHQKNGLAAAVVSHAKTTFIPVGTHTLALDDFTPDKVLREEVLNVARKKIDVLKKEGLEEKELERRTIETWNNADKELRVRHEAKLDKNPNNLFMMYRAGVKPGWEQYKQMVLAPMLLKDSADRVVPTPVTKSYAEGLDVNDYWTQMHGARRGSVMKVQEVREPGYMSKLLMNNTMHLLVASHDCETKDGVSLNINERDVHDRHLAQPFTAGKITVPAGTLLTPSVVGHIKAADKDAHVIVRSPLKCEHEKGICQKCIGLGSSGAHYPIGTNIGVHAAHAVGERAVQLTLKSFHTGGVVEQGGGKLLNSFARFEQLTNLPKKIPDAASLAMTSGKIEKIEGDPTGANIWISGIRHHVGKDTRGNPLHETLTGSSSKWKAPEVGMHVESGHSLSDPSRTFVNPHDLYRATGKMEKVQNHMTNEIFDLYKDEGIKRRAVEVVVKAMSNLTRIHDPGDNSEMLRGEFRPTSVVNKLNKELRREGKKEIVHEPTLRGVEMMPLSVQEDWMAKLQHQRLTGTLLEAAATGAASNVHAYHPIPGAAYGAEFGLEPRTGTPPPKPHY
jgi:DNA-directed RNA polymerase subunit beta'